MESNLMKRESLILKQPIIGTFGSKLTFTIGTAYIGFGLLGFAVGAFVIKKPMLNFPTKRLLMSYYLNNMVQTGLRYANNAGGAAFLYTVIGAGIFKWFDEELNEFSEFHKTILVGCLTGAVYKITLGPQAAILGALIGGASLGSAKFITDELNRRNISNFLIKFD